MRRPAPPKPTPLLLIAVLLVPAWVGAQERQDATSTTASTSATSAPPADTQARTPAKSRSLLGQAMAELTRSVEASRKPAPPPATAPTVRTETPRDPPKVAAQDPVD